ncbi:cytochrome b [Devosia sp. A449]
MFSLPVAAEANRELSRQVSGLHDVAAWALMYLVIAHAGAALFHRYVLKDGVLKRMMPTGS